MITHHLLRQPLLLGRLLLWESFILSGSLIFWGSLSCHVASFVRKSYVDRKYNIMRFPYLVNHPHKVRQTHMVRQLHLIYIFKRASYWEAAILSFYLLCSSIISLVPHLTTSAGVCAVSAIICEGTETQNYILNMLNLLKIQIILTFGHLSPT